MSARRNRSHSRSGAAGERGGGGARRSDPASPPLRAPALRRSQRKSGSEPDAPPQPSTPAPWKTFSLKKIGPGPPAAKGSAPRTPEAPSPRIQKSIPAKRSAPQTPVERSAPQTPAGKSAPGAPTDKGVPGSRAKRSSPQIPAERSEPRTPEAAPAVAGRAISVKKLVARTQESQSPSPRGGRSAAKKKASLSAEVTLSEKENSPPLQENVPLHKGGSSLATGPAPEVTPTVLGPLTPNAVARPPLMDARDLEMSRKVRRSYSRLDELGLGSTSTPNYQRRSFFGFERLLSGEELENVSPVVKESKHPAAAPSTEAWGPDSILPGIPMTKEKRRKRKVPEILKSELDEWAAAMNAQFEAAEKFDLLVE